MEPTPTSQPKVTFDSTTPALVISDLSVTHPAVTTEALRWGSGSRGPVAAATDLDGGDLTAYANVCLTIGAQAITAAGGTQDTFNLEQLVQDVGVRTAASTQQASDATTKAVVAATKAMAEASTTAKKSLTEANETSRAAFAVAVKTAREDLSREVQRLLGGDDPELQARLAALLDRFGTALTERADKHTGELFEKATQALNPDDPASPLAKQQAALAGQHKDLVTQIEKQHGDLKQAVLDLTTAVRVQTEAGRVSARLIKRTPKKGESYESRVNAVMAELAAGLGDEYLETGHRGGAINGRNMKGDGVLVVGGGPARVVLEMSDSERTEWGDYLEEAERNRQAHASLGLVPTVEQNGGVGLRVVGPRRLVLVFDADADDLSLLRATVQLLRFAAQAAVARADDSNAHVARERIEEALATLAKIDTIRTTAGQIRKSADNVSSTADTVQTSLTRLLFQAQAALAAVTLDSVPQPPALATPDVA